MPWLKLEGKRLKSRLLEAGLAPRYVRRVTRELSDHLSDIEAELIAGGMAAGEAARQARQRLGTVDDLEGKILARPPKLSLVARHPAIAFSFGSFGAAALLVMGTLAILLVITQGLEFFGYRGVRLGVLLSHYHYYFASYAAVPAMAAVMCWTAYWHRVRLRWAFLSIIVLAVAGGIFFEATLTYTSATPIGQHGTYSVGFGYYGEHIVRSVWRLLSPLAVFGTFAAWMRTGRDLARNRKI
jgi:hypothetical protein